MYMLNIKGRIIMKEKIIVITGGASGLGLELVKQSIARGLYVCNMIGMYLK